MTTSGNEEVLYRSARGDVVHPLASGFYRRSLYRVVDGRVVRLSPQDPAWRAELWTAWDAANGIAPRRDVPSLSQ